MGGFGSRFVQLEGSDPWIRGLNLCPFDTPKALEVWGPGDCTLSPGTLREVTLATFENDQEAV